MSLSNVCTICRHPDSKFETGGSSREFICTCPRCGTYPTTLEFREFNSAARDRFHLLSGFIRELNENGEKVPALITAIVDKVLQDSRIPADNDIDGKQDKLLHAIRRRTKSFGASAELDAVDDYSLAYGHDPDELCALLREIELAGWITMSPIGRIDVDPTITVTLTGAGWKRTEPMGKIVTL